MAQSQPDPKFNAYLAALIALYVSAESALLGGIAGILRLTRPDVFSQVAAHTLMRQLTAKVTREVAIREQAFVEPLVRKAIEAGKRDALAAVEGAGGPPAVIGKDLAAQEPPFDFSKPHGERSVEAIKADLISPLDNVKRRLTRLPDDVYKVVSPAAAAGQALGYGYTPAQAQAYAWREYVRRGVTGFTDVSGRDWSLSAYVEMSVRTATMRAYNDSHLQVMQASGIELFTVSDDGHPCPLCFPWQNRVLSVEPDPRAVATIDAATEGGLFHPNCFPGFVLVSAPSGVSAADSRWYEGDLVVIHTASGNELSVTPNHPVLTPEGWVNAGDLVVGQHVIRYNAEVERVDGVSPDDEHVEARIGDVFDALRHASGVTTMSVPSSAEQFHGDGGQSDVEVVLVHGLLQDGEEPGVLKQGADGSLFVGGMRFAALLADGALGEVIASAGHAADGLVRSGAQGLTLCARHASESLGHGHAQVGPDSLTEEPSADAGLGDAEMHTDFALRHAGLAHDDGLGNAQIGARALAGAQGGSLISGSRGSSSSNPDLDPTLTDSNGGRDLARRLASDVSTDSVISVRRESFAGHVYNLQSGDGWYTASSIVVHNCKHVLAPFIPGITDLPTPTEWTPEMANDYNLTQKQRRLELEIRKAKKTLEYSSDPDTTAAARRDVRKAQAKMRAFIESTGFLRQSRREQLDLANGHLKLPTL